LTSQRDEIPAELLGFIHACIDSVEQLQVLLLLATGNEPWTVESLSRELRSSPASVKKRVRDLQDRKVLSAGAEGADGVIRFTPVSPEVAKTVRELDDLFRQRPHRVIAQIFAKPPTPLQSFSDAFKLKKEEDS
jgi:hypothetical protein